MRHAEIRPCCGCGRGVCHDGQIFFYRLNVEQHLVNTAAVQRATGMELMMGGHVALARVLDGNPDITHALPGTVGVVCFDCYVQRPLAELVEGAARQQEGAR